MIVVAPNTFKKGWLEEVEKHGFQFDVHIWRSTKKSAAADFLNGRHEKPPVLIINYEAARIPGVTRALQIWASRGHAYLVIDRVAIQIKSHKRLRRTKAIHKSAAWSSPNRWSCRYSRILTGRPSVQGPHDLWGQLRAIGLFQQTNFYAFTRLVSV